jgi:hypothetical protein
MNWTICEAMVNCSGMRRENEITNCQSASSVLHYGSKGIVTQKIEGVDCVRWGSRRQRRYISGFASQNIR